MMGEAKTAGMDYKKPPIQAAAYDRHNARRKKLGMTWTEYLDAEAPEWLPGVREAAREGAREAVEEARR